MNVLVLNSGSSSLKFKLFSADEGSVISHGEVKNYGDDSKYLIFEGKEEIITNEDWEDRVGLVIRHLLLNGKLVNINEISHIIHRVVHGGEIYTKPIFVDATVLAEMKNKILDLAPLHNPFSLSTIEECIDSYPGTSQIAVFDSAFGLTMPEVNYLYALPLEYYEKYQIRRYAFHGISHSYVMKSYHKHIANDQGLYSENTSKIGKTEDIKIISLHLGSGCSACSIKGVQCVDTSFGYTPEENIVMATRVGEIDYTAVQKIRKEKVYSDKDISELLNLKSGLLGVSGYTHDMKVILKDRNTNKRAKLALDIFINSVVKQVMAMVASLNGVDVLIFTGGIGQGSDIVRQMICERLGILGIYIDVDINANKQDVDSILNITGKDSKSEIIVIPTDEESEMLEESRELLKQ
ncbi:MAG: acetate/propionate family kinase [Candidatus Dojkabacteria bacterium]